MEETGDSDAVKPECPGRPGATEKQKQNKKRSVKRNQLPYPGNAANAKRNRRRIRQDSNLRGGTPADFESAALTARPRMQRMLCGMRMASKVLRPSLSEVGTRSAAERGERVEGGAAGRRIGGRAQGGGGGMRTLRAASLIVVLTALSQGSVRELPCTRGLSLL